MIIEQLTSSKNSSKARVSAMVKWEDCDRDELELFFETDSQFADGLICNPNAFFIACIMSAFREGERRLLIDGEICPDLFDGVQEVMTWMRHWHYSPDKPLVKIEAERNIGSPNVKSPERAALFFSGGVDSISTLRANALNYPPDHPGAIKDGLLVFGLEVHQIEKFEYVIKHLSAITKDAGINLVPIYTNIRDIGPIDTGEFWTSFWYNEFEAAAFSAIAHSISNRFSTIYLSASIDVPSVFHRGKSYFTGSHPLIDPKFSSRDISIKLAGVSLSRYEKVKLFADWNVALNHLRVCNLSVKYDSEFVNCGECEKCLRTMLELHAAGALDRSNAFAKKDISLKKIKANVKLSNINFHLYEELLDPLSKSGNHDIVRAIKRKLFVKKMMFRTIEPLKEFDNKYMNGSLIKLKRLISNK